jgi:hypothetical protein
MDIDRSINKNAFDVLDGRKRLGSSLQNEMTKKKS